jgi:sugar phosphate isomerase/epimerase
MPLRQPSKERLPMMSKDFREILEAFNAHGVKYLVVGGYAFGAYSEPRTTKDIDLWIRTDAENAKAVFAALAEFGAPIAGTLCAKMSETSRPSTITVGRGKKSHFDEHKQDKQFFGCVGSFGA